MAPQRNQVRGVKSFTAATQWQLRIRVRLAVVLAAMLALAAPAIAATSANSSAAAPAKAFPVSYLKLSIGDTNVLLRLHLAYSTNSADAMAALAEGEAAHMACSSLGDLSINGTHKLCDLFSVADGQQPRRRISRTSDTLHVDIRRLVRRRELASQHHSLQFCTSGDGQPPSLDRLIVEAKDGLHLRTVQPMPVALSENKVELDGLSAPCSERSPTVGIYLDPPNLEPPDAPDVGGPVSFADLLSGNRWQGIDNQVTYALQALPSSLLMALPAMLLIALLRAIRGRWSTVEEQQRRRAARMCWIISACAWLPFIVLQWGSSVWLWRHTTLWTWIERALSTADFKTLHTVASAITSLLGMIAAIVLGAGCMLLLVQVIKRLGWKYEPPILRPLLLSGLIGVALLLLGTAITLKAEEVGAPSRQIPYEIYLVAVCLPLTLLLLAPLARSLPDLLDQPSLKPPWLLLALALTVLVIPFRASISSRYGLIDPWEAISPGARNLVYSIAPIATYLALFPATWLLGRIPDRAAGSAPVRYHLGGVIFAAFVIGNDGRSWAALIGVLLAVGLLWPRVACAPTQLLKDRWRSRLRIQSDYPAWIDKLGRAQDLRESLRGPKLREKLGAGEWQPQEWVAKRAELEQAYAEATHSLRLPNGASVRSLILSYAIEPTRWGNAKRALQFGLPWIALIVFLQATELYGAAASHPQPQLVWLATLIGALVLPAALALLFGYFFEDLRGTSGLNKALWLTLALALARTPSLLTAAKDSSITAALAWTIGQQSLLLIFIGVLGFDYARMRLIQGRLFDWRRFTWFGDVQLLSTGVLTTAAALAPLIAGLVNQDFAAAIIDGLKATLPPG